jgi:hypothetical protein
MIERRNPRFFWFLHTPTGKSWAVDNPVVWSLEHAHEPILERARERLVMLDAADPQRVIRLVVRRCRLNLSGVRTATTRLITCSLLVSVTHGEGDPQWSAQATHEMRDQETRYNQPQPPDRRAGPGGPS